MVEPPLGGCPRGPAPLFRRGPNEYREHWLPPFDGRGEGGVVLQSEVLPKQTMEALMVPWGLFLDTHQDLISPHGGQSEGRVVVGFFHGRRWGELLFLRPFDEFLACLRI